MPMSSPMAAEGAFFSMSMLIPSRPYAFGVNFLNSPSTLATMSLGQLAACITASCLTASKSGSIRGIDKSPQMFVQYALLASGLFFLWGCFYLVSAIELPLHALQQRFLCSPFLPCSANFLAPLVYGHPLAKLENNEIIVSRDAQDVRYDHPVF